MAELQSDAASTGNSARVVPGPPRPVGSLARKRAWIEPGVRFWWIAAILIVVAAIGLAVQGVLNWREENFVIREGVVVEATAFTAGEIRVANRPIPMERPVTLDYEFNGRTYSSRGMLTNVGQVYISGQPFEVRIDPRAPENWSNRQEPTTIVGNLFGAIMALFAGLFTGAISLVAQRLQLQLWSRGQHRTGRVLGHSQSALAPRSVSVRCAVRVGKHEKALSVFVPQKGHVPGENEAIELITNAAGTRAIAVANYIT